MCGAKRVQAEGRRTGIALAAAGRKKENHMNSKLKTMEYLNMSNPKRLSPAEEKAKALAKKHAAIEKKRGAPMGWCMKETMSPALVMKMYGIQITPEQYRMINETRRERRRWLLDQRKSAA